MGSAFLTGWALDKSFYSDQSYDHYIDSTLLISNNSDNNIEELRHFCSENDITELSGFSLGAILALELAQTVEFNSITLHSPCFSFVSRTGSPHGIKGKLLDSMINSMNISYIKTLSQFHRNSGTTDKLDCNYSVEELVSGLNFLKDVSLPHKKCIGNPLIKIIHAVDGRIIPIRSGQQVAEILCVSLQVTTGGHISSLLQ